MTDCRTRDNKSNINKLKYTDIEKINLNFEQEITKLKAQNQKLNYDLQCKTDWYTKEIARLNAYHKMVLDRETDIRNVRIKHLKRRHRTIVVDFNNEKIFLKSIIQRQTDRYRYTSKILTSMSHTSVNHPTIITLTDTNTGERTTINPVIKDFCKFVESIKPNDFD